MRFVGSLNGVAAESSAPVVADANGDFRAVDGISGSPFGRRDPTAAACFIVAQIRR